jgi:tungstate transport system ATP-binding protein
VSIFLFHFYAEGIESLNPPIYEIKGIKHNYDSKTVLEINYLSIQKSSIIGLVGPNGSGKSTFLRLLGLIEKPTEGEIYFDGYPVAPFSDSARFLVSLLPQEPFLMKRNVYKNISYGLKLRGNVNDIQSRVEESLLTVGLTYKEYAQREWYALSGGERQRVALASRLALKPRVLLLDEPTASVDSLSEQLIKDASLRARKQSGTTIIIASHDRQWLYETCDEILHFFQGKILETGQENFIFGPWEKLESGKWGKILSDGQKFYVTEPPNKNSIAVIKAFTFGHEHIPASAIEIDLKGVISRLSLEKKTGQIFATFLVGNLPLTLKLKPHQNIEKTWFPGNKRNIRYRLDQLKWI